jgi:hypothetical protein
VSDLASAIRSRHLVRFRYGSDPAGASRWVAPHVLFEARTGKLLLDGVQVAGHSSRSDHAFPAWRRFDVAMITELDVLAGSFDPDPALRLDPDRYPRILAAVDPSRP